MSACLVLGLMLVDAIPDREANGLPHIRSESALIRYADSGEVLLAKLPKKARPIASVTKLMSALVIVRSRRPLPERVTILEEDKDRLKWSRSRLRVGTELSGIELFRAALVASDNRAMYALIRAMGYERPAFVKEMNVLAEELGMTKTRFTDPAGLQPENLSTAQDVLKLLGAVVPIERIAGTTTSTAVSLDSYGRALRMRNTNRLLRSRRWKVLSGKTGYTVEAGRCLATRVEIDGRRVDMIFLGSREMQSVFGDAGRVRRWIKDTQPAATAAAR